MAEPQETSTVIVLTTTQVPYVCHIPTILSCPNGITYRFRYQNKWLHEQILSCSSDDLREHDGLLYIRDDTSQLGLCYPLRRFKILWKDDKKVMSFFNFKMGSIVRYQRFQDGREHHSSTPEDNSKTSWQNVLEEYSKKSKRGIVLPPLDAIAVPGDGEPPILTDQELHNSLKADNYVWLDMRDIFAPARELTEDTDNENDKWSVLMSTLSLIDPLRNTCFWRILRLSELRNEKKTFPPTLIAKSDKFGLNTYGYKIDFDKTCSISICQLIPRVFAKENFEGNPFDINLRSSDPDIDQIISSEIIDGNYDTFELFFRFHRRASRKVCLLRVENSQQIEDSASTMPRTVLPISVNVPKRRTAFRSLFFVFLGLIPFVGTILDAMLGPAPRPSMEIGVSAITLGLSLLFGHLGGWLFSDTR